MDKIKLGIFDVFTYILPGTFVVLSIYLILFIRTIQSSAWNTQRVVILITILIMAILFFGRAVAFHESAHRTLKYSFQNIEDYKKSKSE